MHECIILGDFFRFLFDCEIYYICVLIKLFIFTFCISYGINIVDLSKGQLLQEESERGVLDGMAQPSIYIQVLEVHIGKIYLPVAHVHRGSTGGCHVSLPHKAPSLAIYSNQVLGARRSEIRPLRTKRFCENHNFFMRAPI